MAVFCLVILLGRVLPAEEDSTARAAAYFEQHVRPLLATRCLKCHGEEKQESNLRLDSLQAMLEGGDSGPAIVPGQPGESLLIEAIRYESLEMPPTGQLPAEEIRHLEVWIAANAVWPEQTGPLREAAAGVTAADRQWWAFRAVGRPAVPVDPDDHWSRTPIDRFVYRRLVERDMRPAPRADRETLVRRLYFDLLGLPPTPEEIDAFLRDDSPAAWARQIDRLLEDPRYGEHWARSWLDLVRYSDSDGWNQDAFRPHIWRYRDYVIEAFNRDKPYPQFVREQLAGDEIGKDDPGHLVAAGFLRLGIYEYNQRNARGHWDAIVNELTDVTGDVFLGMGMACARCHDHKFDPLLQRDYFKLRAFFEPLVWRDDLPGATADQQAAHQKQLATWEEATEEIRTRLDDFLKPYYDAKWFSTVDKFPLDIQACFHKPIQQRTSWEHQMAYLVSRQFLEEGGGPLSGLKKEEREKHEALLKELAAFDDLKPEPLPELMTATDFAGTLSPTVIPDDPRQTSVEPGFLTVLSGSADERPELPEVPRSSGRRTALAQWIGRADNPLTMRVIVNRIWQQHFGEGLVRTPSDFGRRGQPPTHPELLDWMTSAFIQDGASIKKLHKRILMSAVWQQSAHHPEAGEYQERDPAENLLWRARIRRLRAEQVRDAMLSVSGELQHQVGGPSVDPDAPRRALYVKSFRNNPEPFLHSFDMANGLKSVSQRDTTTTPVQALLLMNGDYALGRARRLAEGLLARRDPAPAETVRYAFRLTWGREPNSAELAGALDFVCPEPAVEQPVVDPDHLVDFCHVLLNSNEFLYVE